MKNQKRLIAVVTGITLPLLSVIWCCTKPTKDFIININSDIISYTATFTITDAKTGGVPSGLTASLAGTDSAHIYDYSGTRALKISGGVITVGVDPKYNPSGSTTLSFSLLADANNYLSVNVPVTIGSTNYSQSFAVQMININNAPEGVSVRQQTNTISGGTTSSTITAATLARADATTTTSISIPAGTQFQDASGNIISGSSLITQLASYDPADALQLLPGGQVQNNVAGGPSSTVVFTPAGFSTVVMKVGSTEVKKFSKPVEVLIGLNPDIITPSTGTAIKAGDQIDIYSYSEDTGIWTFEKTITVTGSGSNLFADFTTTHLCSFIAHCRNTMQACTSPSPIGFNAPNISDKSSEVFIIDIFSTQGNTSVPVVSQYIAIHDKDSVQLRGIPSGNVHVKVSLVDYTHYSLKDYSNRGTSVYDNTISLCSGSTAATYININYTPGSYLSGTGKVVCPNDASRVYLPPDGAQVYYRKSSTTDAFRILGLIVDQSITTSQLTVGQSYDFRGNYSGRTVGRTNVLIRAGSNFMDTTMVVTSGSPLCQ